jgi:UDP-N-acetylmuramoylalanine--D-glutamate ligase
MKSFLDRFCMIDFLRNKLSNKRIVLLGFGREGQSSFNLIRRVLPETSLTIADIDESIIRNPLVIGDPNVFFKLGTDYFKGLDEFDMIIKTPGISLKDIDTTIDRKKITSQTDLFLEVYSNQVIGITGTKGKSTTSTLLHTILKRAGKDAILLGNIGRPAFNSIEDIHPDTLIIYEMSSHQLEYISVAPHISVLLNLFQEHLDAYHSFRDYQLAKMNIMRFQNEDDYFIYNADDSIISGLMSEFHVRRNYQPFSFENELADGSFIRDGMILYSDDCVSQPVLDLNKKRKLKGDHNVRNMMAVINVCKILGIENEIIQEGIAGFTGLEHRMEYAGQFRGIHFYNDSIATIPEAAIEAVKALETVDTLILGGFDRGLDYTGLAGFLSASLVRNFIFTGDAGKRICDLLEPMKRKEQKFFPIYKFDDFLELAWEHTLPGSICLLSPAAASYDEFQNFEMRGKRYKELLKDTEKNTEYTDKTE